MLEACHENNLARVQYFIDQNIYVNYRSQDRKWSALAIAAKNNYLELLDILLNCDDINVNLTTSARCTDPFNTKWGSITALAVACHAQNHLVVRRLLRVPGIRVNYQDSEGWTAVHWAAAWCGNSVKEFVGRSGRCQ